MMYFTLATFHFNIPNAILTTYYWLLTRKSKFADIHSGPQTTRKKKREGTGGRTHIEEENITKRFHSISIKEGSCSMIIATLLTQVINSHHNQLLWKPNTLHCNQIMQLFPIGQVFEELPQQRGLRTKLCIWY